MNKICFRHRILAVAFTWAAMSDLAMLAAGQSVAMGGQGALGGKGKGPDYVLRDGSVQIITAAPMTGLVERWDALFQASHGDFHLVVRSGDNYSAMSALIFDRTLIAPLGGEFTRIGYGDNLKIAAEPIGIRVGHATLVPGRGVPQLGVIVNAANPLTQLTMPQLASIFAVGATGGDIAVWSQAGVEGVLSNQAVHPVGLPATDYMDSEDPQVGEFLSLEKLGGLTMNHVYQPVPRYAEVLARVQSDPAAIGIIALNQVGPGVKVIALKRTSNSRASAGSAEDIVAGRYPLDRCVYVYVRMGKGMSVDQLARDYALTTLTAEGQRALAEEGSGYLPLNAGEVAQERAKLDP